MLKQDGAVSAEQTRKIVELAGSMSTTFHRAIDMCSDPVVALEDLVSPGIGRALTSGQWPSALDGEELIGKLVGLAGGRTIMPGVGINSADIAAVLARSDLPDFTPIAPLVAPDLPEVAAAASQDAVVPAAHSHR